MEQKVLDYLTSQRIGVFAVEMLDGSPHSATVHFAHTQDPLMVCIETSKGYRKSEPLLKNTTTRASFVVGTSEGIMETLQMDGIARLITEDEKEIYEAAYYGKFPEKKKKTDPTALHIVFIPTWWRFTQWVGSEKHISSSEDK